MPQMDEYDPTTLPAQVSQGKPTEESIKAISSKAQKAGHKADPAAYRRTKNKKYLRKMEAQREQVKKIGRNNQTSGIPK